MVEQGEVFGMLGPNGAGKSTTTEILEGLRRPDSGEVRVLGNVFVLIVFVLISAFMFVAMGYFISSLAKTQESVMGISQLINFPMMFLSGLFFPVDIMPARVRPVVVAMPLTYLADALRQIMVGATPVYPLILDFGVLGLWLVGSVILAVRFFRWE